MIILGIDPGSRITGFALLEVQGLGAGATWKHLSHGVIQMQPHDPFPLRMKELGQGMEHLLQKYRPQQVVIEKVFLGKNADSAFKLGHARGVSLYEAAKFGAEVFEYATRSVKQGITGSGGASKEEVKTCLERMLKVKAITRMDASDALALATFHAFRVTNPLHAPTNFRQNLSHS
jgi:crossover junction endodeoxyribonuclease RuvC